LSRSSKSIKQLLARAIKMIDRSRSSLKKRELRKREVEELGGTLLSNCREIVAKVNSDDLPSARRVLARSKTSVRKFLRITKADNKFCDWGYVIQVLQEYLEASMLYVMAGGKDQGTINLIKGFPEQSILYGLSDLIGELRRRLLKELTKGNIENARSLAYIMTEVYAKLERISLADSVLPGFRRKLDVNRTSIDITMSELSEEVSRKRLRDSLDSLRQLVERSE